MTGSSLEEMLERVKVDGVGRIYENVKPLRVQLQEESSEKDNVIAEQKVIIEQKEEALAKKDTTIIDLQERIKELEHLLEMKKE